MIRKSSASTLVDDSMSAGRKDRTEEPSECSPFDSPFSEPVVVPIEDFIDLHTFSPRDIPSVVEQYLEQCIQADFREVRIIHGKGTGVQRKIVRSILEKHPAVLSFRDAPQEAGGWGATFVLLNISKALKDK
jgi:dsDNA-specific endonuclease/ATPase MutS2